MSLISFFIHLCRNEISCGLSITPPPHFQTNLPTVSKHLSEFYTGNAAVRLIWAILHRKAFDPSRLFHSRQNKDKNKIIFQNHDKQGCLEAGVAVKSCHCLVLTKILARKVRGMAMESPSLPGWRQTQLHQTSRHSNTTAMITRGSWLFSYRAECYCEI